MCFPSGGDGGASAAAAAAEQTRESNINTGMSSIASTFAPFNDDYFNNYNQEEMNQATPGIAAQDADANQQTLFNLARTGTIGSSAAGAEYGKVADTNNAALLQASNQASSDTNALRTSVAGDQSDLVNQLEASADPEAAATTATADASALTRPPTYSPVTNLFSGITSQFAANEQARSFGLPGYGFGIAPQAPSPFATPSVTTSP